MVKPDFNDVIGNRSQLHGPAPFLGENTCFHLTGGKYRFLGFRQLHRKM